MGLLKLRPEQVAHGRFGAIKKNVCFWLVSVQQTLNAHRTGTSSTCNSLH